MQVDDQLRAPAPLPLVPTGKEAGWAHELVCAWCRKEEFLMLPQNKSSSSSLKSFIIQTHLFWLTLYDCHKWKLLQQQMTTCMITKATALCLSKQQVHAIKVISSNQDHHGWHKNQHFGDLLSPSSMSPNRLVKQKWPKTCIWKVQIWPGHWLSWLIFLVAFLNSQRQGIYSSVVRWGTMLQATRSQVPVPKRWNFPIYLILPAAVWSWDWLSL
jgi:hypothetical protein